eukprot:Opistho-2@72975
MDVSYLCALPAPHPLAHIQLGISSKYVAIPYGQGKAAVFARDDPHALLIELGKAHTGQIAKCAFGNKSSVRTSLCTVSSDCAVVWHVEDAIRDAAGKHRPVAQMLDWSSTESGPCEHVFFSPDDTIVGLCAGFDVLLFDAAAGSVHSRLEGHTATVTAAAFSPHRRNSLVVSISEDRTFKVWDITEGSLVYQSSIVSSSPFISLAMDPLADRFAIGSEDGAVRFYDAASGANFRCLHTFDVARAIRENRSALDRQAAVAQKRAGPQVISSKKGSSSIADSYSFMDAPSADRQGDDSEGVSTSPAVLCMHYAHPTPPLGASSASRASVGDSTLLVVGTAGALAQIDTRSYDAVGVADFCAPVRGAGKASDKNVLYTLPTAGAYGFSGGIVAGSVVAALGCAFERSVCILSLSPCERGGPVPRDTPVKLLLQRIAEKCRWPDSIVSECAHALSKVSCSTAGDLETLTPDEWHDIQLPSLVRGMLWDCIGTAPDQNQRGAPQSGLASGAGASATPTVLTVVPSNPLSESSPLRSEMAPPVPPTQPQPPGKKGGSSATSGASAAQKTLSTTAAKSVAGKAGGSGVSSVGGKKKVAAVVDKPLTFNSKIKSSGYGAPAAAPVMFAGIKARPVPASSKAKGASASSVAGGLPAPRARPVEKRSTSSPAINATAPRKYPRDSAAPTVLDARLPAQGVLLHPSAINRVAFSADGKMLATAGCDKNACVLKLPIAANNCTSYRGHNGPVTTVQFNSTSTMLLTSASDATARLWAVGQTEPLLVFSHSRRSYREGESADKPNPPFAGEVRQARMYYMDKFVMIAAGGGLHMFKFHADDERVDDVKRYKTNNRYKLVKEFQMGNAQGMTDFGCVNGFHSYAVVCAGTDRSIEVFDMNVGKSAVTIADAHTRSIHAVRLLDSTPHSCHTPTDHDLFATAAAGDAIKLWDIRTQKCVRRFEGHSNRALPVGFAFSPCGRFLATGSEDRCAYVYDIGSGTYTHKLQGHSDSVVDVDFHPIVPMLVTATLDGKLRAFLDS